MNQPSNQADQERPRRSPRFNIFFIIVGSLISIYTLTYSGGFRVDDEHIVGARAQSLALWGALEDPQVFGNMRVQSLRVYGDQATQIEPLQSIIGAGLYKFGRSLGIGGAQSYLLQNLYLTALTAGMIYLAAVLLRMSQTAGALSAMLYGLGSMAWPYAMAYYRDSLASFCVSVALVGFVLFISHSDRDKLAGIALVGLGCLGGILSKNSVILLVPAILFGLVYFKLSTSTDQKSWLQVMALLLIPVLLIVLTALIPSKGPFARFSLEYYSSVVRHFTDSLKLNTIFSFFGPFVSPSKSIFIFNPALILVFVAVAKARKYQRTFSWVALGFTLMIALAQSLFYGERWGGTFGWSLRFMLPVLPGLFVLVAGAVEGLIGGRWGVRALAGIAFVSILIQLGGVFVAWNVPYIEWHGQGLDPFTVRASWDPRFLVIPSHLKHMVLGTTMQIAWVRTIPIAPLAWAIPILNASALVGVAYFWISVWKSGKAPMSSRRLVIALAAICIIPIFPGLLLLRADPIWGGYRTETTRTVSYVSLESRAGDVVLVDPYGSPLWKAWMNLWDQPIRWYSLPFETPGLNPEPSASPLVRNTTSDLLSGLALTNSRLWYVTSSWAPDFMFNEEIDWLDSNYKLEDVISAGGEHIIEIRLYDLKDSLAD